MFGRNGRSAQRKPRILVVSERYRPETFLVNDLVGEWRKRGYKVSVLTQVPSYPRDELYPGYPNRWSRYAEQDGGEIIRFPTLLGYNRSVIRKILNYALFAYRASLSALVVAGRFEAIFVYHTGPLTQAIPVVFAKLRKPSLRAAIWTQDVWPDTVFSYGFPNHGTFAALLKFFVRVVYRAFDSVLVTSPGFRRRLAPYLSRERVAQYVPQWPPPELHEPSAPFPTDRRQTNRVFCFAGNIGKMQNLENTIRAFGIASQRVAGLEFHILGDGSLRKRLMELTDRVGGDCVHFWGRVELSEVRRWFSASDFLVLPLASSPIVNLTLPAKFQAYLTAGKPLLTISDGEVADLTLKHEIGLVASPDEVEDIAQKVIRLSRLDGKALQAMQARIHALLTSHFDRHTNVDALLDALVQDNG